MTVSALLVAWGLLALTLAGAWAWQRKSRNAGVVDLIWSASIGVLALLNALAADGHPGRRLLVALLAGVWSGRLTWLLARRLASEPEDGRYAALRRELGERIDAWLFVFFQAQGALAVGLSLVFWVLVRPAEPGLRVWDAAGVLLFAIAQAGEALADHQLHRWRSRPANRGRTCRAGLWRWSRHPNYFFEWLHWIAWALLGVSLPYGALLWLAPALMLLLVLKVTGIPPTEARALETRGEDYRDYQRTTSAFFPLPPRRPATEGVHP